MVIPYSYVPSMIEAFSSAFSSEAISLPGVLSYTLIAPAAVSPTVIRINLQVTGTVDDPVTAVVAPAAIYVLL